MVRHSGPVSHCWLSICLVWLWLGHGCSLCGTQGRPPYLIAPLDGGLNNQRWSLLTGLLYARQRNLTYVLPATVDVDHRNSSCSAARRKKRQPLAALYDVRRLAAVAAARGPALITDWSPQRQDVCCQYAAPDLPPPSEAARPPGHCISSSRTFVDLRRHLRVTLTFDAFAPDPWRKKKGRFNPHLFYLMNPELDAYRRALAPAPAFAAAIRDVTAQLQAIIGKRPYAVVHARFEDDIRRMETMDRKFHLMTEAEVTQRLALTWPPGSPIQVCSGLPKAELRELCARFECFQIFDVRLPPAYFGDCPAAQRPRDLLALFDFYVALAGTAFYGTLTSSFSVELYMEFARRGKSAAFLNWDGRRES
eukprot:EG_transcript_15739